MIILQIKFLFITDGSYGYKKYFLDRNYIQYNRFSLSQTSPRLEVVFSSQHCYIEIIGDYNLRGLIHTCISYDVTKTGALSIKNYGDITLSATYSSNTMTISGFIQWATIDIRGNSIQSIRVI